jgi:hypothetical protein
LATVGSFAISRSGNAYKISFGFLQGSALLENGVLKERRRSFRLTDLQHAGIALVPVSALNAGVAQGQMMMWRLLLWHDTKTSDRFGNDHFPYGGPKRDVEALRESSDFLASTPQGQVACLLDKAIMDAHEAPLPALQPGSYLPLDAQAVWIPSLGSSIPV